MMAKPTESELEILQVLWALGNGTVREVNEELVRRKGTDVGYTTTLKLMQIMHEKGIVSRDTSSRTHMYSPLLTEASARKTMLDKMISTMFKGSAADLVMQALSTEKSSEEELRLIREFLDQLEKK